MRCISLQFSVVRKLDKDRLESDLCGGGLEVTDHADGTGFFLEFKESLRNTAEHGSVYFYYIKQIIKCHFKQNVYNKTHLVI